VLAGPVQGQPGSPAGLADRSRPTGAPPDCSKDDGADDGEAGRKVAGPADLTQDLNQRTWLGSSPPVTPARPKARAARQANAAKRAGGGRWASVRGPGRTLARWLARSKHSNGKTDRVAEAAAAFRRLSFGLIRSSPRQDRTRSGDVANRESKHLSA